MHRHRLIRRLIRIFQPVLILALIGLVYHLGIHSERTGFVRQVLDPGLKRIVLPVLNAFRGRPPEAGRLALIIDPTSMDSLTAIRDRAMTAGVLDEGKDTWFPASVVWKGDTMPAELRLKGGLIDHLRTNKWSYRIRLTAGGAVEGMGTFSIQHPNTRNFCHEWIFHRTLADQGLPHLAYGFIDVEINGRDLGIHAIEQHFDSLFLARLGLPGPVIKFDDEPRIATLREMNQRPFDSEPPMQGGWQSAPIEAFGEKHLSPAAAARFHEAADALDRFRQGRATTTEVFDASALARLFALSDLLGAQHSNDWRNLRFVPDSTGERLLPIGFDANAGEPIQAIRALREAGPLRFDPNATGFYDRLFSDTLFYRAYISALEACSAPGWLEGLLSRLRPELDSVQAVVLGEFPSAAADTTIYLHDRTVIRQTLHPADVAIAYLRRDAHGLPVLSVANAQALPLRITALMVDGERMAYPGSPVIVPRARDASIQYVEPPLPAGVDPAKKIRLVVTVLGVAGEHTVRVSLRGAP